jgi:hypothetical protein
MLCSSTPVTHFVSSPIHPRSSLSISLTVFKGSGTVEMNFFATTRFGLFLLRSDAITVSCQDSDVHLSLHFFPETSYILVNGDDSEMKIAIAPAVDMIYIVLQFSGETVVGFDAKFDKLYTQVNSYPALHDNSFQFMKVSLPYQIRPQVDSSAYNAAELIETSRFLIDSLVFLLRMELRRKLYRTLSAKTLFQVLLSANPFPQDESLSIGKLRSAHSPVDLLSGIRNRLTVDLHELTEEFCLIGDSYRSSLLRSHNQNAIFYAGGPDIHFVNCYVIHESQFMISGFCRLEKIPNGSLIIPFSNFFGSIVEFVVTARHFIILSILNNSYEFSVLFKIINDIINEFPALAELFENVIELARLVAPPEKGFPNSAFFIAESIVHKNPEQFLLPRYLELVVDSHWCRAQLPASFNISHPAYFGIRGTDDDYNYQIGEQLIKSNSFVLLQSGDFTVKGDELESIEYVIWSNLDLKFSAEVQNWRPHHSHQLLLTISSRKGFKKNQFQQLPLSTQFSFETARFMYAILHSSKSGLFRVQCHFVNHDVEALEKDSGSDRSSNGKTTQNHFCEIADFSRTTPMRFKFLKQRELHLFSLIHPELVRIGNPMNLWQVGPKLRKQLNHAIKPVCAGNKAETWFVSFLKNTPDFVVFMVAEFVLGKWITTVPRNIDKILLFFVQGQNIIEAVPRQKALVLGQFQSEEGFRIKFGQALTDFYDQKFKSLCM